MTRIDPEKLSDLVGSHVRHDFTTLKATDDVAQALVSLRSQTVSEKIVYFYVTDADGKLVGVVPTRRFLMSLPEAKIADIMVTSVISIPDTMSVLDACEFFVMHRLLAFPVVDSQNRLIGVVDVGLFTDEMFDVSEQQTSNDVFQLIGIHVLRGRHRSPLAGFKDRFPWLLCNIGGGLACAFIAGLYEKTLNKQIILALFIPVVLALAESVSIQSMTITLQGFREGNVDWRQIFRSLRAEFLTAGMLGAATGFLIGLVCWLWKGQRAVAMAIGISVYLAIITACLLGVLLPALVRVVKGDPKIAAGPVVLACADVATLLFYFNLSLFLLQ